VRTGAQRHHERAAVAPVRLSPPCRHC
jgi:hypothetical protein